MSYECHYNEHPHTYFVYNAYSGFIVYKCIIKLDWVCMCLCNAVILPVYYIFGIPHHVLSVASARGVVQCACSVQRLYKLLYVEAIKAEPVLYVCPHAWHVG